MCSCGNPDIIQVRYSSFAKSIPTCGKCQLIKWKLSKIVKYGKLTLMDNINSIQALRHEALWQCDCGIKKKLQISRVISGNTTSCGCAYLGPRKIPNQNHPVKSKQQWMSEILELVDKDLPNEWSFRARLKTTFKCQCSREFQCTFWNFKSGITKCGYCDSIKVYKGYNINGFKYDGDALELSPHSVKQDYFLCKKCGDRSLFTIRYVFRGEYEKCGNCRKDNIVTVDLNSVFGHLRIKEPRNIHKYSTEIITWICDCGNETQAIASNVLNGTTKSCGNCRKNIYNWWLENKDQLQKLKCPINAEDFPIGGITPLEQIKNTRKPFKANCPSCGNEYFPRWEGVRVGISLTCGCTSNRISSGQNAISVFINSLGHETKLEHPVNGLKYDIFIPTVDLLIEYNGLKWHSLKYSKQRDLFKYKNAVMSGYQFMSIFEDEWIHGQNKVKNIIKTALNANKLTSLRPSKCEIKSVDSIQASTFYDQFHYIGPCKAKISYGVYYQNKLIACASFSRPTRQSKHDFELIRMSSDPAYRVHGIWSKLLKQFITDHKPSSIVSFSDNRLFSGGVYEKIGFKLDGEVNSDYYWVKGNKRFHKSGLRKTKEEKLTGYTETQLREAQGYKKIWDLGKKRWVYLI